MLCSFLWVRGDSDVAPVFKLPVIIIDHNNDLDRGDLDYRHKNVTVIM